MNSGFLIVLLLIGVVMYFLLIRPQRAQQRRQKELISNVAAGDEVVTVGGIYGDVVEVDDDGEKLVLEIAEDVHVEIARRAIGSVVKAEDLGDFLDTPSGDADAEVRKFDPGDVRTYSADDVPAKSGRGRSGRDDDADTADSGTASDRAR